MKHRRGPFSEDLILSRDPDRHERQMLVDRQRDWRDAITARARQAGMTPGETNLLLGLEVDEVERFLANRPRAKRLQDLARSQRLRATCTAHPCRHRGWVDLDRRRFGHILLRELGDRLVCGRCGAKGARLEVGPGWSRG
ncbi:hypothetical protein [Inquilinus sp. CA228]|uniref:hypothetical protein n=1 Tax=Inquilinus sp. CA228 TaxID=3455609 RepID=UPI003F8D1504